MWRVEAYLRGRSAASFFVAQLRELRESLVSVATAIAEVTILEWVKTARRAESKATLGS
jgi:hypothetical protein